MEVVLNTNGVLLQILNPVLNDKLHLQNLAKAWISVTPLCCTLLRAVSEQQKKENSILSQKFIHMSVSVVKSSLKYVLFC